MYPLQWIRYAHVSFKSREKIHFFEYFLNDGGGVRGRGGVALANGPDRPDGPNGQRGGARLRPDGLCRGKPCDTPGGTLPQCGVAQAGNMLQGRANRSGMLA